MPKKSAGILLFRKNKKETEVFLVHPGGPFYSKKDDGAWVIPKGEFEEDEDPLTAAKREFSEETGMDIDGDFIELSPVKQKGGKLVYTWAVEGDIDASAIVSNTFEMEWPPKSGKKKTFPEIDKAAWFTLPVARNKILQSQMLLLDQLSELG